MTNYTFIAHILQETSWMNILNSFTTQYNLQKEKIFENNKSKAKKGKLVSDNYFFRDQLFLLLKPWKNQLFLIPTYNNS